MIECKFNQGVSTVVTYRFIELTNRDTGNRITINLSQVVNVLEQSDPDNHPTIVTDGSGAAHRVKQTYHEVIQAINRKSGP